MSIQLAAKHLAAHGRNSDTTLVHMTPGEVASLQALAQQHGGSLSINPQTGLPEAGFLSALLPMAAGAGLAAMGMPAGYAALSVGAASAATNGGDLRKSLMVGISAYGGAGMAESFMGAGLGTMGGAMGAPAAEAAPTVLATPAGATSPYALTGSTAAAPSTAGYSLGEPSSFLNQPLPSLVSTAPAQVAQAAAAATPAAQAAQQAAALDSMSMGQRFDALKAGATGTNALNYIKANPFTSLGVATAAMTPDENKTPQKAADTDRGPRAGMRYYSGYGTSLPAPNMQGVEQTYNRPYYAAEGGVTRMATGGITSAPRNQQQLFADYLQRVSSSGVAATPPTNKYDWWKNPNDPAPAAPAPAETAEEYAARMRVNARGGGGGGQMPSAEEREAQLNEVNDYLSTPENPVTMNQYWAMSSDDRKALDAAAAERNPIRGTIYKGVTTLGYPMFLRGAEALQGIIKDFMGPSTNDPKSVGMVFPTEKDRIKAEEAAKYNQSLLGTYSGYTDTGTSEIDRVTAEDAANAAYQRAQAEAENDARIQGDLNPYTSAQFSAAALPSTPYASGRNSNYSPLTSGYTTPEARPVPSSSLTPSDIGAPSTEPAGGPIGIGYPAYKVAPDIVGINEISADPNADKTTESLGIPDAATFAAMLGAPFAQTAAFNNGVVSDAGVSGDPALAGYQGGYNPGYATPNMGNRGSSGVAAGFGGLGSAWQGVVDRNGNPVLTSQGAAENAYNESPLGIQAANDAETQSLLNRYPAPSSEPQGPSDGDTGPSDGGDTSGGYADSARFAGSGPSDARGGYLQHGQFDQRMARGGNVHGALRPPPAFFQNGKYSFHPAQMYANGGLPDPYNLGSYSDGGRLLKGPGDGVSDSIPATIGKGRPARLADGEFVIPARIVSEIGNGSTDAGARKLYAMMDRIQAGRKKSVGKGKVAVNSRADKHLPA